MRATPDRLQCHVIGIAHLRFNNEKLSDTQVLGNVSLHQETLPNRCA
jgi:hypothetical protein